VVDLSYSGVLKFLQTYGYHMAGMSLTAALEAYQRYAGIPVTGEADDATLAHMCQRRCCRPDNSLKAFATSKWNKNLLTWKFVNYTLDIPQHEISDSFNKGFGVWSAVTPLVFQEVLATEKADINITFKRLDSQGQVLAQAWFPPVGTMEFDESELWSWKLPIGRGQVDLATVVAHEAGHVIGLEHSNVQGSQMAPVYAGPMRFLTEDDIRRAQAIYGKK